MRHAPAGTHASPQKRMGQAAGAHAPDRASHAPMQPMHPMHLVVAEGQQVGPLLLGVHSLTLHAGFKGAAGFISTAKTDLICVWQHQQPG